MFVPYVTIITHCAKFLGSLKLKYNLGSIIKMGYKDPNNSGKFVKVHGVLDDDKEDEETAPTEGQAVGPPITPSLA